MIPVSNIPNIIITFKKYFFDIFPLHQDSTADQSNADSASTTTTDNKSPLPTPKGKADPDGVARKLISFMKCRKIAAIIREIQMYQNQPYPLRVEPTIRVSFGF